ncbi:SAM-dependent methyltransferase [Micromonospora sp. KC207]|uniref:class I SAM-dependent methyltransferase n=1 Tax=Micromonospora sp. KC207 TaxID=2530377 RepID=UPI001043CED5|nr:SAM-dependent methyltransferase [Micromonospora sp. KC207]TDC52891.1 SAM-dependent methyltransferase [Micromonospora sp. KC207]
MSELGAIERTALLTAALRAAETRRPDRLYTDPYAEAFAGEVGPELLAQIREVTFPAGRARTLPSTPDYNAIRTRFFDDLLISAVAESDIDQVVVAPCGMDARAFRLDWPRPVRFFDVDRPVVLAAKRAVLGETRPSADVRPVGVDLRDGTWTAQLTAAGYRPDEPSIWLLEGLLYYLPEPDVHRVLDAVRGVSADGSLIAADVVNRAALTLPNMRGLLDVFASWGCPWLFGTDEPEELFARHGVLAEAIQPGEPDADYGRWPDPVPPRSATDVRRVFFVRGRRHER